MDYIGFIIVFMIAVLAGLGVGSGGLLIIYLSTVYSIGQLQAQSVNLVFFVFSAGASLLLHYTKHKVDPRELFPIAAGGIAGSFIGSRIASAAKPQTLSSAFGALLIISGVITLVGALKERKNRKRNEQ